MSALSPRHLLRDDQELRLAETTGLGAEAAACAVRCGEPGLAVRLLDQARGVLLAQAFDANSDLTELARKEPELAARLVRLRDGLDESTSALEPGEAEEPHGVRRPRERPAAAAHRPVGRTDRAHPRRAPGAAAVPARTRLGRDRVVRDSRPRPRRAGACATRRQRRRHRGPGGRRARRDRAVRRGRTAAPAHGTRGHRAHRTLPRRARPAERARDRPRGGAAGAGRGAVHAGLALVGRHRPRARPAGPRRPPGGAAAAARLVVAGRAARHAAPARRRAGRHGARRARPGGVLVRPHAPYAPPRPHPRARPHPLARLRQARRRWRGCPPGRLGADRRGPGGGRASRAARRARGGRVAGAAAAVRHGPRRRDGDPHHGRGPAAQPRARALRLPRGQ